MTRAEAETIATGGVLIHPATTPPWRPLRVTEAWTSAQTGRRYVRIATIGVSMAPATEYGRPKASWVWAERAGEWCEKDLNGPPVAREALRARMATDVATDEEVAHVAG